MLSGTTVFSLLLAFLAVLLSGCHSYQMYPLTSNFEERQIFRREHLTKPEDSAKLTSDIFGSNSDESSDRSRFQEENDSSSSDELSMFEIPIGHPSQVVKRRKGPTLSVVNPLEILRQRLMLDLARRRIHENQQQIVANGALLEKIGKRSMRHPEDIRALVEDNYQP